MIILNPNDEVLNANELSELLGDWPTPFFGYNFGIIVIVYTDLVEIHAGAEKLRLLYPFNMGSLLDVVISVFNGDIEKYTEARVAARAVETNEQRLKDLSYELI